MSLERNPKTVDIDKADSLKIVELMNDEDKRVAFEVEKAKYKIAKTIDEMEMVLRNNGKVIYVGSGTSGKLAVIDASECPPTYGIDDDMIKAVISGGDEAVVSWKEETEDDTDLAINDLKKAGISNKDILIGISASGNTPYAVASINYAKSIGSKTAAIFCSQDSEMEKLVDTAILVDVGAEVIAGSTRLKAGTAQKMVLNMLSTGVMIRLGYVYSNLMINVKPINKKLRQRLVDIVSIASKKEISKVKEVLEKVNYDAKKAIEILGKEERL